MIKMACLFLHSGSVCQVVFSLHSFAQLNYKRLKFALAAFKLFFYKEYLLAITLAMPQMNISTAGHCYSKHLHLFSAGLISNSSAT